MIYHVTNVETNEVRFLSGSDLLEADCPNLKVYEFACKDGNEMILYHPQVVRLFQAMRTAARTPITVNSAFRTRSHNAKKSVGGAADSKHLYGMAMDLDTPDGWSDEEFYSLAETVGGYLSGIGIYNGRVHIDCRKVHKRWDSR